MRLRCLVLTWLACAIAIDVSAQAVSGGLTVGASTQTPGRSDSPYLGPGFGGTAWSAAGFVDVRVTPRVSVGGEVSTAGPISGMQQQRVSGGDNWFISEHRDTIWSALLKAGHETSRFRVIGVAGPAIAVRSTNRSGTFNTTRLPPAANGPFHEDLRSRVLALTAGADVSVAAGLHAALIGLVRFHLLADDDRDDDGVVRRGVSSRVFRYGAGLRLMF